MELAGQFAEFVSDQLIGDLRDRAGKALELARRNGSQTLASATVQLERNVDPAACVMLGQPSGLPWTVIDQPDNDRSSIAGIGVATELKASGEGRFEAVATEWRRLAGSLGVFEENGPSGSGPIAIGGFAFNGGSSSAGPWSAFGASSMIVPSVALRRTGNDTWLSLQVAPNPDDDLEELVSQVSQAISVCSFDGDLVGLHPGESVEPSVISSVLSPAHYEAAVSGALEAIDEGRISKVVLAREVLVESKTPHSPAAVFSVLREVFPSCFIYSVRRGESTFVGASPELLVRRQGSRATTIALAGSAPRSADPAVDDHIGERLLRSEKDRREQGIVTDRIVDSLDPFSVWVTASPEPHIAKIANVQHLATPIRAQLRAAASAIDLLGALHPTPAVGGEPWNEAQQVMSELEGMDRGWYAAPIGWTDAAEDGEFCVALRGGLLSGNFARCYAGVGVVEGSDPAAELAETELKLQAVIPVVSI